MKKQVKTMHANLHLITETELIPVMIEAIMEPFYEGNFLMYDKEKDEYIEPDVYPQFRWDYYTVHPKIFYPKIEDCFIIIDPEGRAIARRWWNGKKWIDQNKHFEKFIKKNKRKWKGCYMLEIDVHW